jgi:hypothetical protein
LRPGFFIRCCRISLCGFVRDRRIVAINISVGLAIDVAFTVGLGFGAAPYAAFRR